MLLFAAHSRRDLEPGRQKVAVFRYVVFALDELTAKRAVLEHNSHLSPEEKERLTVRPWSEPYDDEAVVVPLGCYTDKATDTDRAERSKKALEARRFHDDMRKRGGKP